MITIELYDHKGDYWQLTAATPPRRYMHNAEVYYKMWWHAFNRPGELRHYKEVPLPVFTEWWPE